MEASFVEPDARREKAYRIIILIDDMRQRFFFLALAICAVTSCAAIAPAETVNAALLKTPDQNLSVCVVPVQEQVSATVMNANEQLKKTLYEKGVNTTCDDKSLLLVWAFSIGTPMRESISTPATGGCAGSNCSFVGGQSISEITYGREMSIALTDKRRSEVFWTLDLQSRGTNRNLVSLMKRWGEVVAQNWLGNVSDYTYAQTPQQFIMD